MENNHNDVISPVPEETVSVKPEQETVSPSEEPSEATTAEPLRSVTGKQETVSPSEEPSEATTAEPLRSVTEEQETVLPSEEAEEDAAMMVNQLFDSGEEPAVSEDTVTAAQKPAESHEPKESFVPTAAASAVPPAEPHREQELPAHSPKKQTAAKKPASAKKTASAKAEGEQKKKSYNSYKRSSVRQFSSLISLLIMVPVFALLVLFNWFVPRSEESMIEKRKLASFPAFTAESYFSGQFTAGINTWFTDTAPYRDDLKNAGNSFKGLFGITTDDSVNFVGDVKKVPKKVTKKTDSSTPEQSQSESSQPVQTSKTETSKAEQSSQPEESSARNYREEDAEYSIENGVIVVYQDGHYRGLEMFGGGSGNAYVDALNDLRTKLNSSVKMYSMIAPLASEYYTPANCEEYTMHQKEYFDDIASRLNEGIVSVDIDTVLAKHTEEPIYCRTDHHWMPLGAYYAADTFAKAAGVDFKELSTFQPVTIEGFVGTMYAFSGGDINIKNDPENFIYYVPDNYAQCHTDFYDTYFNFDYTGSYFKEVGDPQSNAYLTFFGGDEQIVKIRTNVKNGRKLMVIKDSYGNAVPGYLMNSFEEIYIADMRYFNLNLVDFIEQLGMTDVLFTMCTFSAFGDNSYNLPQMIEQNAGLTIVDDYQKEETTE